MKARLPEAAGGRPGHAGRSGPGPASFSGPSSRMKTAGAGTPVFGALAASLLAAAALLLAPGAAWAQGCGGTTNAISTDSVLTCSDGSHSAVRFIGQGSADITIIAPGGTATTISGTSATHSLSLTAASNAVTGNYAIYLGARPSSNPGATGAASLTGAGRGINIDMVGSSGSATVEVGSGGTIGSSTDSIDQHGIRVRGGGGGSGTANVTITNAGTIYATYEGIDAARTGTGTLTVTHTGAITSTSTTGSPGMLLVTQDTGPMVVTTSGDVTATGSATTQRAISMRAEGNGAITLTATGGTITSSAQGIHIESRGTGAVTIQGTVANTGPTIAAGTHGIHVQKTSTAASGNISITTTGGSITAGTGTSHHGIHVQDHSGYTGNVTIDNAADITAGGRGISVDRQGSGSISVTVAAGTTVTGGTAGVYVGGAATGLQVARKYTPEYEMGQDGEQLVSVTYGDPAVALRNQLVTVRGTVNGGTGAAVRLSGGGGLLVLGGGSVRAGSSGVAISADGPALVYIDGEVRGGAGGAAAVNLPNGGRVTVGLNGRVEANGAGAAIRGAAGAPVTVTVVVAGLNPQAAAAARARVVGGYENVGDGVRLSEHQSGMPTGYRTVPLTPARDLDLRVFEPGTGSEPEPGSESEPGSGPAFSLFCDEAGDRRCRMYEALPSMLLALNALPSYAERSSSARDAKGGWARVEASGGEWRAKKAATATTAGKLAYDYRWVVARAGMDFAPREDLRVGWSVHAPRGKAEMSGVGEVELDGVGAGVSATWRSGDFYVDAQAAVTRYGVGLTSDMQGKLLNKDASGVGYALGVEGGKRMPVGETFVTPRAGLAWSDVDLDFTDMETAVDPELRARVSLEDARSVKGRVGVTVEKEVEMGAASGHVFGSLDVERELSDETEVKVGEERLKTEVRPTAVSLGAGAVFDMRENVLLRAVAGYRTSGGGTSGYRGSLEVQVRF